MIVYWVVWVVNVMLDVSFWMLTCACRVGYLLECANASRIDLRQVCIFTRTWLALLSLWSCDNSVDNASCQLLRL